MMPVGQLTPSKIHRYSSGIVHLLGIGCGNGFRSINVNPDGIIIPDHRNMVPGIGNPVIFGGFEIVQIPAGTAIAVDPQCKTVIAIVVIFHGQPLEIISGKQTIMHIIQIRQGHPEGYGKLIISECPERIVFNCQIVPCAIHIQRIVLRHCREEE